MCRLARVWLSGQMPSIRPHPRSILAPPLTPNSLPPGGRSQVTLDALGAKLVAEGMLELLGKPLPAAVGGMSIGADPITAAIITIAGVQGLPAHPGGA